MQLLLGIAFAMGSSGVLELSRARHFATSKRLRRAEVDGSTPFLRELPLNGATVPDSTTPRRSANAEETFHFKPYLFIVFYHIYFTFISAYASIFRVLPRNVPCLKDG